MKGSKLVFDYVQLFYDKSHKKSNGDGSYIDSLDWIKNKKVTITPTNKKDDKCFKYSATAASNHEEIGKNHERITKIKHFMDKYKWKGINFPSKNLIGKNFRKIIRQLLLMFCMPEKNILLMFQNLTQIVKPKYSYNDSKRKGVKN